MVDDGELVLDDRNGDIQLNSVPKVAFQVRHAQFYAHAALACRTAFWSTDRSFPKSLALTADCASECDLATGFGALLSC
jgi:hypothetical protein